jgi:hypothetical protein
MQHAAAALKQHFQPQILAVGVENIQPASPTHLLTQTTATAQNMLSYQTSNPAHSQTL